MRVRGAAVLAGLGLLAGGCGGGGGGGNALPAAADVVPANAAALISVDTDFSSGQWRRALALTRRFPGAAQLLRRASAQSGNLSFDRDVKPALGPEVDVVWLDFAHGGNDAVALTQPKNEKRFAALIRKGNSTGARLLTTKVGDWTVAADSRAGLAQFRHAASSGKKLADDQAFKDAMGKLDGNSAVRAYVAGGRVQTALDAALEGGGAPPDLTTEVGRLQSLSASAGAETKGVRFDGAIGIDPALAPDPFAATLPGELPGGALLYVSANSLDDMTRTVLRLVSRSLPSFDTQLGQVEAVLGFSVRTDLLPLLAHEASFAVYPARPLPTFVVVIKVGDTAKAKRIFSRLSGAIALGLNIDTKTIPVGGVDVTELDFPRAPAPPVKTFFAAFKGKFAFTTDETTMRQLIEGPNSTLEDDPAFAAAKKDAGMPVKTTGFAYAKLHDGLPFVFRLAAAGGSVVPAEARTNTKPLRTALVYTHEDGKLLRLSGFATIK